MENAIRLIEGFIPLNTKINGGYKMSREPFMSNFPPSYSYTFMLTVIAYPENPTRSNLPPSSTFFIV